MDDLYTWIILLVVLWSVLGGLFGKKGQGKGQGTRRAPPRRMPDAGTLSRQERTAPDSGARTGTGTVARAPQDATAAADMIPDDLWEILTGERRRPARVPAPADGPGFEPDADDEEGIGADSWARDEVHSLEDAGETDTYIERPHPTIVSLETLPLPDDERHTAFHVRLDELKRRPLPGARVRRRLPLGLDDLEGVRRAFVLREVLGPPKGLE